jgi:arylsulfotransferase ASST
VVLAVLLLAGGIVRSVGEDGSDGGTSTDAGAAAADDDGGEVQSQAFVTRPDLRPPVIDVTTSRRSAATRRAEPTGPTEPAGAPDPSDLGSDTGYVFLAPKGSGAQAGALILDGDGEVVWSRPSEEGVTVADFRVQTYRGQPVLTWWEGRSVDGHGQGEFVVADTSYQELRRFPAGSGRAGDLHELQLTDAGTALVLAYQAEPADLTAFGGPADGHVYDNLVQEIDVATGELLFEWSARDHIPLDDTYDEIVAPRDPDDVTQDDGTAEAPFDAYHLNSVALSSDGSLLVSARNTQAVYSVDRATGAIRWILGGKHNAFSMGEGATFHWQHDVRRLPDGTISMFDNQADPATADQSRALVLSLDEANRVATLVRQLVRPEPVLAGSQGNTQVLADGSVVVGWGGAGAVTQFGPDDDVVLDAGWSPADSYRVFRQQWTGQPTTKPDVVARMTDANQVEVFASWNGATEVTQWQVLAGSTPASLQPVASAPRDGFETRLTLVPARYVAVQALDASGTVLSTSAAAEVGG